MKRANINPRIIKVVRLLSRDDHKIVDYLIDILYEEAEHMGKGKYWQYSDCYKRKIQEYCEDWSG